MTFPKSIKQAKKMKLPVYRECKYYTEYKGMTIALQHDWNIELAYSWRKKKSKVKK